MAFPIDQQTNMPAIWQPIHFGQELITALENKATHQLNAALRNPQLQHIPGEMLGKALVIAIQKGLHGDFLPHVNLNPVPVDDEGGLGHAVLMATHTRRFSVVQYIFERYPAKFNGISPNLDFGIGQALLSEIMHLNHIYEVRGDLEAAYLKLLINHPSASSIDVHVPKLHGMDDIEHPEGKYEIEQLEGTEEMSIHLGILLRNIVLDFEDDQSDAVLYSLLHPNIAHLVEPNGRFGIGRALVHAAHSLVPDFVKAILNHPKAALINSSYTSVPMYKTKMEEIHKNLNKYGLTEAIFLAIFKEDYENSSEGDDLVSDKQEIVEAILRFAEQNKILLDKSGDFGLKASCAIARRENYGPIVDALQAKISD